MREAVAIDRLQAEGGRAHQPVDVEGKSIIKAVAWLLTAPLWYGLARLMTAINPNGHKAVAVVFRKTPPALSRRKRKAGRHYV